MLARERIFSKLNRVRSKQASTRTLMGESAGELFVLAEDDIEQAGGVHLLADKRGGAPGGDVGWRASVWSKCLLGSS